MGGGFMNQVVRLMGCRIALGAGLIGFSVFSGVAMAAEVYPLQSIDFVTHSDATDIFFHTGGIVPYRTVLATDNKIVIDVEKVQSEQTVKTNFMKAPNVSHVVLQPLSNKSIRLIIRGDHLRKPSIGFKDLAAQPKSSLFESSSAPVTPPKPTAIPTPKAEPPEAPPHAVDTTEEAETTAAAETDLNLSQDALDALSEEDALFSAKSAGEVSAKSSPRLQESAPEPLDLSDAPLSLPDKASKGVGKAFDKVSGLDTSTLAQLGIVGFIGLGFVWFIRRKWQQVQQQSGRGLNGNPNANFRNVADQYQLPTGGGKKTGGYADSPIGLRSLQSSAGPESLQLPPPPEAPANPRRASAQSPALPPLPPTAPRSTPPKRQALNQYAKQSNTPPSTGKAAPRAKASDDMLRQELQRSAEVQRQANKQPPRKEPNPMASALVRKAMATPPQRPARQTSGSPLAPNPEVLSFLKSVADLMEKESKPSPPNTPRRTR
jgi:hypothetical protein